MNYAENIFSSNILKIKKIKTAIYENTKIKEELQRSNYELNKKVKRAIRKLKEDFKSKYGIKNDNK